MIYLKHVSEKQKFLFVVIALLAVATIPYLNIFSNEFAFDDFDFFVQWEGVKSVKNIMEFFQGDLPTYHQHAYRPLRSVLQSIVYAASDGKSFGFHVFSFMVQVTGVAAVFLIFRKMLPLAAAFAAAAVFATLPVHTDSITFMTASFDTAAAVLGLFSFYLYILYREQKKIFFYLSSLALAIITFFWYEMMLTLPFLFILYDFFIKEWRPRDLLRHFYVYLPYVASALIYIAIRASIVGTTFTGSLADPAPFLSRMFTMLKAFVFYLYLTAVDAPLSVIHITPIESSFLSPKVFFSLIFLLIIATAVFYLFKKGNRVSAFAVVWFFVSLLPVSNIIPLSTFVSEHYLYLATFGWALLVGVIFEHIPHLFKTKYRDTLAWVFLVALVAVYGYLSFDRNKDWRNDETIFNAALAVYPEYAGGYNAVAFTYRLKKEYEKAEEYAKKAVEINQNYYVSYALLGEIYMEQNRCSEAIPFFTKALEINASYVSAYLNRGACFYTLKQFADAEKDFLNALEIYPDYTLVHKNLGIMYTVSSRFGEAIPHLESVASKGPDAGVEYLLGISFINTGNIEKGRARLENVLRLIPGHQDTLRILETIEK